MRSSLGCSAVSVAVACAAACAGTRRAGAADADAGRLARTYTYNYIGEVMPTPQQATYHDAFLPLFHVRRARAQGQITLRSNATPAERVGAQEIANRIRFLAGGKGTVPIESRAAGKRPWLTLGDEAGALPSVSVPSRDEAYAIDATANGKRIDAVANDALGLYWACQSVVQLLTVRDGIVVLRKADIVDYPLFRVRSFKVGKSADAIEDMADWCPSAKLNTYNICYTAVGKDLWPNPSKEYREVVRRVCERLLPRGMDVMLFINPYYLWKEHIQTSDPADLDALTQTCSIALEQGAEKVMLCLDDFASKSQRTGPRLYTVHDEQDREQFDDDLAKVNIALLNGWYERMKAKFPRCRLLAVLPYYWMPGGHYREEGERNLREIGKHTPKDLVIVWTGPRVRSTSVDKASLEKYTRLIGRKPFLWDNTLYAWHRPPHYFLDQFKTTYPDGFWDLNELGCHYNAGSGEAYKAGLFCVADYLWNPQAYDPESAIRKAVAIVGGRECVDLLLEFRDGFYEIREGYAGRFGSADILLRQARIANASPFDADDIQEARSDLAHVSQLAASIGDECRNERLVAEVNTRQEEGDKYLEALRVLERLPKTSAQDATNLIGNPGAEQVVGKRPAGFGSYAGAGKLQLSAPADARTGKRSASIRAGSWHVYPDGKKWINVALMAGGSNGFTADDALKVKPFRKYYFSFWAKSDLPRLEVSVVGWTAKDRGKGVRQALYARPTQIDTSPVWQRYAGSFVTRPDTAQAALKIGFTGFETDGAKLGTLWVDDVYIGLAKPAALQR